MKYKIIFSDFDGTLNFDKSEVTRKTVDTIKRYQSLGGIFVLCTSRPYCACHKLISNLELDGIVIVSHGASIINLSDGSYILDKPIFDQDAKEMLADCMAEFRETYLLTDTKAYAKRKTFFSRVCAVSTGFPLEKAHGGLASKIKDNKTKSLCVGSLNGDKLREYADKFNQKFAGRAEALICAKEILVLSDVNISKGKAIEYLLSHLNIDKSESLGFGDTEGDMALFDAVGTSVAVENAMDCLKKRADFVTKSNQENGVADFIEKHCLD